MQPANPQKKTGACARVNTVYDVLNKRIHSPHFFLWLEVEGTPATPPPAGRMASFLDACLAELDPDEIARLYEAGGFDVLLRWRFEHAGWTIEFRPIPKKSEARGRPGVRPIGGQSTGAQWVKADHRIPIRDAITKKAGRYGEFDLPYVVAVNVLELADEIDVMEALFGKERFIIVCSQGGPPDVVHTSMSRLPDGAWTGRAGPRYKRVSAALLATRLSTWSIPRAKLRLYHNPWAQRPCQSALARLPQAIPRGKRVEHVNGESVAAILGLPASWPEEES